jgi:hypothetical protein
MLGGWFMRRIGVWEGAAAWVLGAVLGWTWRAEAYDCEVPQDEGGAYLYSLHQARVGTDEQDPRLPLPGNLRAYLPSERELDRMEPPYLLSASPDEGPDTQLWVK